MIKLTNLHTLLDVNEDEYNTIMPTRDPRYALYTFDLKAKYANSLRKLE